VSGSSYQNILAEVRQWFGVHQPQLHGPGQKLRAATGIHHALQPVANRDGRAGYSETQGAVRTPPSI